MEISPCRISQAIWARLPYTFFISTRSCPGGQSTTLSSQLFVGTSDFVILLATVEVLVGSFSLPIGSLNYHPKTGSVDLIVHKYHIIIERDLLIVLKPASEYQTSFDCTQKAMEWKITFVVPGVNHLEVGDCLFEDFSAQWLMPCTQTLSPCLHHHFGQEHLKTEKQPHCSSQHFKMIAQNKTTQFFCNANSQNNIELGNWSCWTKPDDSAVLN